MLALTMGEALIDLIGQSSSSSLIAHSGGAVYNLSRALAALGLRTIYSNPISSDRFGRQLREGLEQYNVELASTTAVQQPTSLAIATLDAQGQAHYSFYREGVADKAITAERLKSISHQFFKREQNNWALTGCLALTPDFIETTLNWLATCMNLGATIAIDVNLRPVVVSDSSGYRNAVLRSLAFADVIKASDEDLQWLFNNELSASENSQLLMHNTDAKLLAITRGSEGAFLTTRLSRQTVYGRDDAKFKVIDTVGAGDCFFAGLVAYLAPLLKSSSTGFEVNGNSDAITLSQLNADQLEGAIRRAIATASLNIQVAGCQPPSRAAVDSWIARNSITVEFK
jgi:fructokinase